MFISWLVYFYFIIPYRTCGSQDKSGKLLHSSRAIIEKGIGSSISQDGLTAVESNLKVSGA